MASSHNVDISCLLAGGRQRLVLDHQISLETFEGVRFPRPARTHLALHAAGGMLEIAGTIDVEMHGECDRCLDGIERDVHVAVDEQIETGDRSKADPFGESNVLRGDRLDVEDLTTQLVCSAVPPGLLCAQECRGICPSCGENKNTGACACARENGDN